MFRPTTSPIRRSPRSPSHLDSMIVLSRAMAAEGMYPAVDPLSSSSVLLDPAVVGEEHYRVAEQVRETIAHYKELQDIISLLGIEELSAADRLIVGRARRLQRFLTQPFAVTEAFTGKPGRSVRARRHAEGLPRHPRRRLRRVGRELALHGRHDRRGAREGRPPAKTAEPRHEAPDHLADDRRRRSSPMSSPCAPRTKAAASASSTGHADFLTALAVSVVSWRLADGGERYCAVRRGVLRCSGGSEVAIATRQAILGDDLDQLEDVVLADFRRAVEAERAARTESLQLADEGDPADRQLSAARAGHGIWRQRVSDEKTATTPSPTRWSRRFGGESRAPPALAERRRAVGGALRRADRRARLDHRGADPDRALRRALARPHVRAPASSGARRC